MSVEQIYLWHKHPANMWLHIVAGIILIFALWDHSILWIFIAFLVAGLGHAIQLSDKKTQKDLNRRIHNLAYDDLVLIKLSLIAFGIFLASFFPFYFLNDKRWIFFILFILLAIKPTQKFLEK